jgi:hypothetical protein
MQTGAQFGRSFFLLAASSRHFTRNLALAALHVSPCRGPGPIALLDLDVTQGS